MTYEELCANMPLIKKDAQAAINSKEIQPAIESKETQALVSISKFVYLVHTGLTFEIILLLASGISNLLIILSSK